MNLISDISDYAAGNLDRWLTNVGFESVPTHPIWRMQQVSRGVKLHH
ncbi:hypothetical protein NDI45_10350 [Leptolyngbya sp. GB1-A1]